MKKKYCKPEIMFESFTLSTNIAGDCGDRAELLAADYACGKMFSDGRTVFMSGMYGCGDVLVEPDQDGDGAWGTLCYHVPSNLNSLVTS